MTEYNKAAIWMLAAHVGAVSGPLYIKKRSDRCTLLLGATWQRRFLYLLGHVDEAPGCVLLMLPAYRAAVKES